MGDSKPSMTSGPAATRALTGPRTRRIVSGPASTRASSGTSGLTRTRKGRDGGAPWSQRHARYAAAVDAARSGNAEPVAEPVVRRRRHRRRRNVVVVMTGTTTPSMTRTSPSQRMRCGPSATASCTPSSPITSMERKLPSTLIASMTRSPWRSSTTTRRSTTRSACGSEGGSDGGRRDRHGASRRRARRPLRWDPSVLRLLLRGSCGVRRHSYMNL